MSDLNWRRFWWVSCGAFAFAGICLPFAWRSGFWSLIALAFGCFSWLFWIGLLVLGGVLVWRIRALTLIQGLLGIFLATAGIGIGYMLDGGTSRRWIFADNYSDHRRLAASLLREFPTTRTPADRLAKRVDLPTTRAESGGFYRGHTEYLNGKLIMNFGTPCGPTLETVLFSPHVQTESKYLRLIKKDDLGYWYFELRQ